MTATPPGPAGSAAGAEPGRRGLGALVTTEVEHAELGRHGARRLRGRVERRRLELAFGRGTQLRLTLGRVRPVAVEVYEAGASYDVPIAVPPTPWASGARRILLWWGLTAATLLIARRMRTMRHTDGGRRGGTDATATA